VSEENIVVREGYGYVGPRLCDPAVAADGKLINEYEGFCRPRYCHGVWVPVGETEGSDSADNILSDGGLRSAQWLQRELGLAQIGALASPCVGYKMLRKSKRLFLGHPGAKFFRSFSSDGVFQQPLLISVIFLLAGWRMGVGPSVTSTPTFLVAQ